MIDRGFGFKGPPIGNGLWVSNVHVTDDVMWLQKVKLMPLIRLERNISKQLEMLFSNNCCDAVRSTVGYPSDSLASCIYMVSNAC